MSRMFEPSWPDHCERAIAGAIVQIELALRESEAPVRQLGIAIGRIAATLREIDAAADTALLDAPHGRSAALAQLRRDLSQSIEQLQFYDRLVQHLSHVRDYLSGVANQLADESGRDGTSTPADESHAWDALRMRLRARLISDPQRELLDLVLPGADAPGAPAAVDGYAAQGSVELF